MNEQVQNIDELVEEVNIVTRTSAKSGVTYQLLQLKLVDGYNLELFASERSQLPLIGMMLEKYQATKPADKS